MKVPEPCLAALLVGLASCVQTTLTEVGSHAPTSWIRTGQSERTWAVHDRGEPVGWVVSFGSDDELAASFFSVRNEHHQELGVVDALGSAWRYRPHQMEAERVATGTVIEGVRAILGTSSEAVLEELPSAPSSPGPALGADTPEVPP